MKYGELKEQLLAYDVITLDVFDTLITRCTIKPTDVFLFVEAKEKKVHFAKHREMAEQRAYETVGEGAGIDDIYRILRTRFGYTKNECDQLMEMEFAIEYELALPRQGMQGLVRELLAAGKRVLLCSDMYWDSKRIAQLLEKCGFPEGLEIWVSCEKKATKNSGKIWEKLLSTLPQGQKMVHVGDNDWADGKRPKSFGIDTVLIERGLVAFERSVLGRYLPNDAGKNLGTALVMGWLINKACFNSPFEDVALDKEILAVWLGFPFACFMNWLVEQKDDSLLLFVTREGYLLQPMYERYCKALGVEPQENCIFYASRTATVAATICSEEDLQVPLTEDYEGTLGLFLKNRLNFELPAEHKWYSKKIVLPMQKETVWKMLQDQMESLLCNGRAQNAAYRRYVEQVRKSPDRRLTVVDIGYAGTIQYALSKVLGETVDGRYLMLNKKTMKVKKSGSGKYVVCVSDGKCHPIFENLLVLEAAMQVPYGQLQKMELKEGVPYQIFLSDNDFSEYISCAQEMYMQFVEWFGQWKKQLPNNFVLDFSLAERMWICLIKFLYIPDGMVDGFWLTDNFSGTPLWKYDARKQCWEGARGTVPLTFAICENGKQIPAKYAVKNMVKKYIPAGAYEWARHIWIKYIK